jgi:hypothetical protein
LSFVCRRGPSIVTPPTRRRHLFMVVNTYICSKSVKREKEKKR